MFPILKRELRSQFLSPLAYVVIVIFSAITGYLFYSRVAIFSLYSIQAMRYPYVELNVSDFILRPLFHNICFLLLISVPVLTMRSFAEEKKLGTVELLFTYPLTERHLIFGKFLGSFIVVLAMILLTFIYPVILGKYTSTEWGVLLSGYLGLVLVGACYISLGIWSSSLTDSQVVAFFVSFGALLFFWMVGWAESYSSQVWGKILMSISLAENFENFSKGILDTNNIIFYLSFLFFFLYLTDYSLQRRKWT